MSTSPRRMRAASLRMLLERALDARAERRARIRRAASLPDLLARLGRRYAGPARRRGLQLALDVDPTLATDLVGPFGSLGSMLQQVIEHAMAHPVRARVALAVDVVHEAAGCQTAHFTVQCMHSPDLGSGRAWEAWRDDVEAFGGALLLEHGELCHLIVELRFIVPPAPPHVDIVALRAMVGGDTALHQVVDALADALAADVGDLASTLARGDVPALRLWLHRVSGALGMVEAKGLAAMGLQLEQDMAVRSLDDMAPGLRRFATDATRALAWLRESLAADPLI